MQIVDSVSEWAGKLQTGRVFRKMGLPGWTFAGVGIAAIWFNTASALVERVVSDVLGIGVGANGVVRYLPSLVTIAIPFALVLAAVKLLPRQTGIRIISGVAQPKKKKGLMLLVSNTESAFHAIRYHFEGEQAQLEHVWLIPSNETEAAFFGKNTRDKAELIKTECEALATATGRALQVEIHSTGVSPADAQDTYDFVNRIYRRSGYAPHELVADFTGGTKPMSVGMIMACLPTERELEYVSFNPMSKKSHGPFLIDYQHSAFDLVG